MRLNADNMQMALIAILLLCGYFYLYQFVAKRTANRNSLVLIAIVLLVVYLVIMVPLVLIFRELGNISFVLLGILLLLSCIVLFMAMYGLVRDYRKIHKGMLMLFVLYTLMMAYITIFSREEGHSTLILLSFDSFTAALETRSFEPLQHVLLNAAMFIPIGILFPLIRPEKLAHLMYVAPVGLMMSTMIETIQMLMKKGQCDIEDIVANTLGAIAGYFLFLLARRMKLIPIRGEDDEYDEEDDEDE